MLLLNSAKNSAALKQMEHIKMEEIQDVIRIVILTITYVQTLIVDRAIITATTAPIQNHVYATRY